ncbi:MAG: hypothetical protein H2069_03905 [Legionella sp.]|nr:hypothetical protein [Legionella sp.]
MVIDRKITWGWSIVGLILMSMSVGCTRYATTGEQMYLRSKNGASVKLPQDDTKLEEQNNHLYDLAPQPKKNPIVSLLPPGQKGIEHA